MLANLLGHTTSDRPHELSITTLLVQPLSFVSASDISSERLGAATTATNVPTSLPSGRGARAVITPERGRQASSTAREDYSDNSEIGQFDRGDRRDRLVSLAYPFPKIDVVNIRFSALEMRESFAQRVGLVREIVARERR